jgi:hypothetical protein
MEAGDGMNTEWTEADLAEVGDMFKQKNKSLFYVGPQGAAKEAALRQEIEELSMLQAEIFRAVRCKESKA